MGPLDLLGVRAAWLRWQRGLTAQKVAAEIGISRSQLTLIENGRRGAHEHVLIAIAYFYGVSVDWLMTGDGVPVLAPQSAEEGRLLLWWRSADEASRAAVLALIDKQVELRTARPDWISEPWRILEINSDELPNNYGTRPRAKPKRDPAQNENGNVHTLRRRKRG